MKILQSTLFRQVLGACGGALAALLLYQAYEFSSPRLLALLPSPTVASGAVLTTDAERADRQDRIVLRARQIIEVQLHQERP